MIIKNGRVFQEDGTFAEKDLYIEGKRFVSTKEEVINQEVIDAKGMMVLPGLVDVHSHGAAGHVRILSQDRAGTAGCGYPRRLPGLFLGCGAG